MTDAGAQGLEQFREIETGEAFTIQNQQLVKVELAATTIMARSGAMVAYQGDVHFEHKGGGMSRLLKKAATGESLRLMTASGSGEVFLANHAMLVHVIRLANETLTVNGANILAFEEGIEWDIKRVKGGAAGMLAGGLFNGVVHVGQHAAQQPQVNHAHDQHGHDRQNEGEFDSCRSTLIATPAADGDLERFQSILIQAVRLMLCGNACAIVSPGKIGSN